jgi:hypothetical protein
VTGLRLDLGDVPGRVAFAVAVAWLVAGLLRVAGHGLSLPDAGVAAPASESAGASPPAPGSTPSSGASGSPWPAAAEPAPRPPGATRVPSRLGATEATVVLVTLDLVFAAFVGLQLVYLFGGLDTLAVVGLTYAEYARRGFFELVAVAMLVGGLVFGIEAVVGRRTRAYVAAALGLLGLTVVVLVSAALRLGLYQVAYGWTELRFYVAVGITVLAVAIATAVALVAVDRTRWLAHAFGGLCLVGLAACVLVGPSAFVADRNVERALDPALVPTDGRTGLDAEYLAGLPDDAVPAIVAALPRLEPAAAATLCEALIPRAAVLADDPGLADWRSWNLARERARDSLSALGPTPLACGRFAAGR